MFEFFKKLFGGNSEELSKIINDGATLIDVRSQGEFASGNVKGSINIPLDKLSGQLAKLKKDVPIVVFCASGMRSAQAKSILKRNGFTNVTNGGGWTSVRNAAKK